MLQAASNQTVISKLEVRQGCDILVKRGRYLCVWCGHEYGHPSQLFIASLQVGIHVEVVRSYHFSLLSKTLDGWLEAEKKLVR